MKLAPFLRSVKLYKPAKWVADTYLHAARRVKYSIYKKKVKTHRKKSKLSSNYKVLIAIRDDGIGNSIEATPLVQAVRMFWPAADITLLVPAGDLYDNWCVPDRIISNVEVIKNISYDHIFLPFYATWEIPDWLNTIDHGQIHKPSLIFGDRCLKSEREYNLDPIRKMGYKGPTPPLYISLKKPDMIDVPENRRLCILPGGRPEERWQNKKWLYYFQLAEMDINKYPDIKICIIGTAIDTVSDETLDLDRVLDFRGKLTLAETAWVLKSSDIVVGNDCGPMHIAGAVGTHGICIFGPTCELKNSPGNKIVALTIDCPCRPCQYNGPIVCRDPKCMLKLKPELVMRCIDDIMKKPKGNIDI